MRHIYVFGPPGSQKTVLMIKANADKFGTTEDSEWITLVHGLFDEMENPFQRPNVFTASRHSIDAAALWFIGLERVCQQQLLVEATGRTPSLVPPEMARYSREHVGSEYIGWLHFQVLYDQISATQPDMFD
jgi:hypothetical protein